MSKENNAFIQAMVNKEFVTYEDTLANRVFSFDQMQEVYRDLTNKEEYPTFDIWLWDMIHSGVFEILNTVTVEDNRNQAAVENVLDRWLNNHQLEMVKTYWKAFYSDPYRYKGTEVVKLVKQFLDEL